MKLTIKLDQSLIFIVWFQCLKQRINRFSNFRLVMEWSAHITKKLKISIHALREEGDFVLRDSKCHPDMKKAPTLPSSVVWALFCLNLPKIGKNSRNMKFSAKMQTSRVHIG